MLDIVHRVDENKKVTYVWFDTGLEYQATKEHLKYLENKYDISIQRERAVKPNAKKHPADQIEHIANSIKEFGFKVPIVIDKNGVIVAGHTRYKAAQKLGFEKLPCIVADDLTEEQVKAFRLSA